MNTWIILQGTLGCAAILVMAWTIYQQRDDFQSKRRYWARNIGGLAALIAAAFAGAYSLLGYSGKFLIAGAVVAWVAVGLLIWGSRGYRPKAKQA